MNWNFNVFSACLLALLFLPLAGGTQTCRDSIDASNPESQFFIHDDGTATHKTTGLMWMRCSLGQAWNGGTCAGRPANFTWGAALQTADRHKFAGHADWRLPNKNELESIMEEGCYAPAINSRIFPETPPTYFWSSSPYVGIAQGAWSLDFGYGSLNATVKTANISVRLVRSGR